MGGGKKGGSQTIGYKHYVGAHLVGCQGPIDYLLKLTIGEDNRVMWEGKSNGGQIRIDKEKLFGGEKREGGVKGKVDVLMGGPEQLKNDYLLSKIGSNIPAYRGVFSLVFRHFYWGMNPYLKPVRMRLQRIYVRQDGISQWYPGKAGVPYHDQDEFPWENAVPDGSSFTQSFAFSEYSNLAYMYIGSGYFAHIERGYMSNVVTHGLTGGLGFSSIADVSIDSAGTAHFIVVNVGTVERGVVTEDGTVTKTGIASYSTLFWEQVEALEPSEGEVHFYGCPDSGAVQGYVYGAPYTVSASRKYYGTLSGRHFAIDSTSGDIVGVFQPDTGPSDQFSLCIMDNVVGSVTLGEVLVEHTFTASVVRADPTSASLCFVESANHWFVMMDGYFYLIDGDTFTIKDSGPVPGSGTLRLRAQVSFPTTGWRRWNEISLVDGSLIRTLDPEDWTGGPISESGYWYDPYNHAMWSQLNAGADPWRLRYFDKGAYDMNPAHMIRECLTDPDWGMGYLDDDVDDDAFEYAADLLHSERMGMSMLWDKQATLEAFIGDVVRHIDAALYVSRKTGKFRLKLTRDDYEVEDLITLDESNITKVTDPSRPAFGELVNSISVKFWQRNTGKDDTVTVHDPAGVQMQGATLNTTIQYDGFTNVDVAGRVADRDLRALSNPFLSCTIYTGESAAADLDIGDVFLFQYPKWQIHEPIVMRITGFAMSDGRSNEIRINCVEDVFSTPMNSVIAPPEEEWVDPSGPPEPAAASVAFEIPYYDAAREIGQEAVTSNLALNPDVGFVGAAAMRGNGTAINAAMWVNDGAGYTEADTMDLCAGGFLSNDLDRKTATITLANFEDLDIIEIGTHAQIGDGENVELVRIDSVNETTGVITIGRGVLDTVPHNHTAGTAVLFWQNYLGVDLTEYVSGETVNVKVQPLSGQGEVSLGLCPEHEVTFAARAFRPYPPGNLLIEAESYGDGPYDGDIDISWVDRDRLQQTSGELFDHFDGPIGPEAGTTYRVQGYVDGVLMHTEEPAVSPTTWAPPWGGLVKIEVHSKRDDVYSMQGATHEFIHPGLADVRVTEAGEVRYTEDGAARVVEGGS